MQTEVWTSKHIGTDLLHLMAFMTAHQDSHQRYNISAQVAVANDGRIFVGDGYCNARVVEFTPAGEYAGEFVLPPEAGPPLQNPHSIVLQECARALYVAEREASRVHRFSLDTRKLEGWPLHSLPLQCLLPLSSS